MQTKLDQISKMAKMDSKCRFNNLMHLLSKDNLKECFYSIRKNSAVGKDGINWSEYEIRLDDRLDGLVTRMKILKHCTPQGKNMGGLDKWNILQG